MPLLLNPYQNLTPNRALVSSPTPLLTSAPIKGPTQNSLIRSTWIAISPNFNHPFDDKRLNRREGTWYFFRKPSGHSCELNCFFTTNTCRKRDEQKRLNRRESTWYYFRKPSGHSCELNCFFTTNTCRTSGRLPLPSTMIFPL